MKTLAICLTIALCFAAASVYLVIEAKDIIDHTYLTREKGGFSFYFDEPELD